MCAYLIKKEFFVNFSHNDKKSVILPHNSLDEKVYKFYNIIVQMLIMLNFHSEA